MPGIGGSAASSVVDREPNIENFVELARSLAQQRFVAMEPTAQLDIYALHKECGEGKGAFANRNDGDHRSWHAHLLITTCRLDVEGFGTAVAVFERNGAIIWTQI